MSPRGRRRKAEALEWPHREASEAGRWVLEAPVQFTGKEKQKNREEDQWEELDEPLALAEIQDSVRALATGKTPGPDDLPSEFYQTYSSIIAPRLLRLYEEALSVASLTATQREELLISLLEPGKSPAERLSYRPLAMLNTDDKILAKVLAMRLLSLVPDLIHPDLKALCRLQHFSERQW
ncbi:hypothetical protein NDU88_004169 [Pleurodeles waltl]|uniref:Uncharacterized protein n=1 Tax=Pleurodeles waltl TaxID=8319 RepID=A0AAV7SI08_PLEWA|nr:hypothetical protein NDU88_004169 [Pleurodeles waltl]